MDRSLSLEYRARIGLETSASKPAVISNASGSDVIGSISDNAKDLEECASFRDVFVLVRKSVMVSLGMRRAAMMLYLQDLPLNVGAYHPVGTNSIVMNRSLLNVFSKISETQTNKNAFIYSILLHEYIHALGCLDESEARKLVCEVSASTFGEEHIATKMATNSPWAYLPILPLGLRLPTGNGLEIVKQFDDPVHPYIA